LKRLDDDLGAKRDIVDTTLWQVVEENPKEGITKAVLGGIYKLFDHSG
jgi:hypothetical protein